MKKNMQSIKDLLIVGFLAISFSLLGNSACSTFVLTDVCAETLVETEKEVESNHKLISALQTEKRNGRKAISEYAEIYKANTDKETKEKIDNFANEYMDKIGIKIKKPDGSYYKDEEGRLKIYDGLQSKESIEDCVTAAKAAIDAIVQGKEEGASDIGENAQASSTSDFIMVGGNWVTPNATYGQLVDIVLPVVNMGMENLSHVTVTPVISNTVNEWPFVIETSGYTQTITDLPGKGNGQSDMDRRRELTWTFRTRDDALSGYYRLQFNVLYYVGTEVENCTLTTYVKVRGATGSGNIENEGAGTSTPRVIVTGYTTDPQQVHAGDTFKLTLHLKNTSQRTAVSNMLVNFSSPSEGTDMDNSYAVFLPTSGSNSVYVDKIGKGSEKDVTIELTAKSDLSQKPYQMEVSMEFEDEEYTAFTANADVSIPILQDARFELSKPEILPEQINVGAESNVMFSIYNLGKVTLYNVHVSFEGDAVSGGDSFLGKIDAGGTGSVDAMVRGEAATTDGNPIKVVITYENDAGEKSEYKEEIALTVIGDSNSEMGAGMYDDVDDSMGGIMYDSEFDELEYVDEEQDNNNLLVIILVAVGLVILVTVIVFGVRFVKKKKEQKADMDLLSDLEEEGDNDEIS